MDNNITKIVDENGTTMWLTENGREHREDGPAVIFADGSELWCLNGLLHRDDGPAVILLPGFNKAIVKEWYVKTGHKFRYD